MADPEPVDAEAPQPQPIDVTGLGYADALAQLEAILRELEAEAVDVDRLAEQVRRATALIDFCRSRVEAARMEVTQVMVTLDGATNEADSGDDGREVASGLDTDLDTDAADDE